MPETVYALTHRNLVFDGTNVEDLLDFVHMAGYPNAYISASANYPGASATLSMMNDLPEESGQLVTFAVGDAWNLPYNGKMPASALADTAYGVDLDAYILARIPAATLAVGYATTPNLGAGASAAVNVPMVPSLPDAGYNVGVALTGSAQLLGALAILGYDVVDADTVEVRIQNTNGLLTLAGATILVTALHNG